MLLDGDLCAAVQLVDALRRRTVRMVTSLGAGCDARPERDALRAEVFPFLQLLGVRAAVSVPPPLELAHGWCHGLLRAAEEAGARCGALAAGTEPGAARARTMALVRTARAALCLLSREATLWHDAIGEGSGAQEVVFVHLLGNKRGSAPFEFCPPALVPRFELERAVSRLGQLHKRVLRQRQREASCTAPAEMSGDGGGGRPDDSTRELRAAKLLAAWYRLDRNALPLPQYCLRDVRRTHTAAVTGMPPTTAAEAVDAAPNAALGKLASDLAELREVGWALRRAARSLPRPGEGSAMGHAAADEDGEGGDLADGEGGWRRRCLEPEAHQLFRSVLHQATQQPRRRDSHTHRMAAGAVRERFMSVHATIREFGTVEPLASAASGSRRHRASGGIAGRFLDTQLVQTVAEAAAMPPVGGHRNETGGNVFEVDAGAQRQLAAVKQTLRAAAVKDTGPVHLSEHNVPWASGHGLLARGVARPAAAAAVAAAQVAAVTAQSKALAVAGAPPRRDTRRPGQSRACQSSKASTGVVRNTALQAEEAEAAAAATLAASTKRLQEAGVAHASYLSSFVGTISASLSAAVERASTKSQMVEVLQMEIASHGAHACFLASPQGGFVTTDAAAHVGGVLMEYLIADVVKDAVAARAGIHDELGDGIALQQPFCVYGRSGVGLSTAVAVAAQRLQRMKPESVCVLRFCGGDCGNSSASAGGIGVGGGVGVGGGGAGAGVSASASSSGALLGSMCLQLLRVLTARRHAVPLGMQLGGGTAGNGSFALPAGSEALSALLCTLLQSLHPSPGDSIAIDSGDGDGEAFSPPFVVLMLDGLSHLCADDADVIAQLGWCPRVLPPTVRVVLTTCDEGPRATGILSVLRRRLGERNEHNTLRMLHLGCLDAEKLIDARLSGGSGGHSRSLRPEQRQALVDRVVRSPSAACARAADGLPPICPTPLFVAMAVDAACCRASPLRSFDGLSFLANAGGTDAIARASLCALETRHGATLSRAVLSLLCLAREGLSEAELLDLLSMDQHLLSEIVGPKVREDPGVTYTRGSTRPKRRRLPAVLLRSLLADLMAPPPTVLDRGGAAAAMTAAMRLSSAPPAVVSPENGGGGSGGRPLGALTMWRRCLRSTTFGWLCPHLRRAAVARYLETDVSDPHFEYVPCASTGYDRSGHSVLLWDAARERARLLRLLVDYFSDGMTRAQGARANDAPAGEAASPGTATEPDAEGSTGSLADYDIGEHFSGSGSDYSGAGELSDSDMSSSDSGAHESGRTAKRLPRGLAIARDGAGGGAALLATSRARRIGKGRTVPPQVSWRRRRDQRRMARDERCAACNLRQPAWLPTMSQPTQLDEPSMDELTSTAEAAQATGLGAQKNTMISASHYTVSEGTKSMVPNARRVLELPHVLAAYACYAVLARPAAAGSGGLESAVCVSECTAAAVRGLITVLGSASTFGVSMCVWAGLGGCGTTGGSFWPAGAAALERGLADGALLYKLLLSKVVPPVLVAVARAQGLAAQAQQESTEKTSLVVAISHSEKAAPVAVLEGLQGLDRPSSPTLLAALAAHTAALTRLQLAVSGSEAVEPNHQQAQANTGKASTPHSQHYAGDGAAWLDPRLLRAELEGANQAAELVASGVVSSLATALASGSSALGGDSTRSGDEGSGGECNTLALALSLAANSEFPKPRALAREELALLHARSGGGVDLGAWDSLGFASAVNGSQADRGARLTAATRARKRRNRAPGGKVAHPDDERAVAAHAEEAAAREARGGPAPAALASTSTASRAAKQLIQNSMAGLGEAEIGKSVRHANVDSLYPIPLSDVACASGPGGRGLPRTVGHKFSSKPMRKRRNRAPGGKVTHPDDERAVTSGAKKKPLSYQKATAWSSGDMREPAQWDVDKEERAKRGVKALVMDGAREANTRWMSRVRATRAARTKKLREGGSGSRDGTPVWSCAGWTAGLANAGSNELAGVWLERLGTGGHSAASSSNGSQRHRSVLLGHDGPVTCVSLSADGSLAVTGGEDATVRLWDSRSTPPISLAVLRDHAAATSVNSASVAVLACAMAPAGNAVLSGASDATMRLWRVGGESAAAPATSGTVSMSQRVEVTAVAFSSDGALAAAGDSSGNVLLCRVAWKQQKGAGGSCARAEALIPLLRFCAVPRAPLPPAGTRAAAEGTSASFATDPARGGTAAIQSLWFGFHRPAAGASGLPLFGNSGLGETRQEKGTVAMGECELFTSLRVPPPRASVRSDDSAHESAHHAPPAGAHAGCLDANCQWLVPVPSSDGYRVCWPQRSGRCASDGTADIILPRLVSALAGQGRAALTFGYLNEHNTNAGGETEEAVGASSSPSSPGRAAQPFAVLADGLGQAQRRGMSRTGAQRERARWREHTGAPDSSGSEGESADERRYRRPRAANRTSNPGNKGSGLQLSIVEAGQPCGGRARPMSDSTITEGLGAMRPRGAGAAAATSQQRRMPQWRSAAPLRAPALSAAKSQIGSARRAGAKYSDGIVQRSADGLATPCAALSAAGIVVAAGFADDGLRVFSPATLVASAHTGHGCGTSSDGLGLSDAGGNSSSEGCAEVGAVAVSRDGLVIATASADGTVRIWDTAKLAKGTADSSHASSAAVNHQASLASGLNSPVDAMMECQFVQVRTQTKARKGQLPALYPCAEQLVSVSSSGLVRFYDAAKGHVLRAINVGGSGGGTVASVHLATSGSEHIPIEGGAMNGHAHKFPTLSAKSGAMALESPDTAMAARSKAIAQPSQCCLDNGVLTHVAVLLKPAQHLGEGADALGQSKKRAKRRRREDTQRVVLVKERGIRVLWADGADAANNAPAPTCDDHSAGKASRKGGGRVVPPPKAAQRSVWTGGVPRVMATCPLVVSAVPERQTQVVSDATTAAPEASKLPFRTQRSRAAFGPGSQHLQRASEAVVIAFVPGPSKDSSNHCDRVIRVASAVPTYLLPEGGAPCQAEQDFSVALPSMRPAFAHHPLATRRDGRLHEATNSRDGGGEDCLDSATIDALQFSPDGRVLVAASACRRPLPASDVGFAVSRVQLLIIDCFDPLKRHNGDASTTTLEVSVDGYLSHRAAERTGKPILNTPGCDESEGGKTATQNLRESVGTDDSSNVDGATALQPAAEASKGNSARTRSLALEPPDPILSLSLSPCGSRVLTFASVAMSSASGTAVATDAYADLQPHGAAGEVLLWGLSEALGAARKVSALRQQTAAAGRKQASAMDAEDGGTSDDGSRGSGQGIPWAPLCLRGHSANINSAVWR